MPFWIAVAWLICQFASAIEVVDLKCDRRTDPLGVDRSPVVLSWALESPARQTKQSAFEVQVAASPDRLGTADVWTSGRRASTAQHVAVPAKLEPQSINYWRVRVWDGAESPSPWSPPAKWEMALAPQKGWAGKWIDDGAPRPQSDEEFYGESPAPLFRTAFKLDKPVRQARLSIAGLGYFETHLNGRRVGDEQLAPAWTDYRKRVLYSTHDVTDLVAEGENAIGVEVGAGWRDPLPLRMWGRFNLRDSLAVGAPCLIAQLEVIHTDGSRTVIASGPDWRTHPGPVVRSSVYLGEEYDARREVAGWTERDFDDSNWRQASAARDEPAGKLVAQSAPPIRVVDRLDGVLIGEHDGARVYDFGRNFTGVVQVESRGGAGKPVRLLHGELLKENGRVNPLTSVVGQIKQPGIGGPGAPDVAVQQDSYTPASDGEWSWAPHFTFHGFRYVEATGLPANARLTGLALRSDVTSAIEFECSDERLNQLQRVCRNTFESNLVGVQSDCPHREKFGYGGDIAVTADAMCLNYDMAAFYTKAVEDLADAGRPDGALTETAPYVGIADAGLGEGGGPIGWAMGHPFLLDRLHRYYGVTELIEEQYAVAAKWLDLVGRLAPDYLVRVELGDHESITPTSIPLMATAHYHDVAVTMQRLAKAIGREEESAHYANLAEKIREAWLHEFYSADLALQKGWTQTASCAAVRILGSDKATDAIQWLERDLTAREGRVTTGIFGASWLLETLTRHGRVDLAYQAATQREFPGWGHMLDSGATTLWEHWAFSDNTFSHNHPMFGSVSQWMIERVGGVAVAPDAVAGNRIKIAPSVIGPVRWAKTTYQSPCGPVRCDWRVEGGELRLEVAIPPGIEARVTVPTDDVAKVTESKVPAAQANGVTALPPTAAGDAVFSIGSGQYVFVAPLSLQVDSMSSSH